MRTQKQKLGNKLKTNIEHGSFTQKRYTKKPRQPQLDLLRLNAAVAPIITCLLSYCTHTPSPPPYEGGALDQFFADESTRDSRGHP
jgi:hypothetical protein